MHRVCSRVAYSSCTGRSSENICSSSGDAPEQGKLRPVLLLGCPGVLDFLGDVLITTDYPDKCDEQKRQIIHTQKTCMLFTSSLLYSNSLSLSPFPLNLFVGLQRDDSSRTSCLSCKNERKKERKMDPKFMTWLLRRVNKGLGFGPHTNDWGNI
jgi:hypothetical protein